MKNELVNDFRYMVKATADNATDGCECDDICRCRRLECGRVERVDHRCMAENIAAWIDGRSKFLIYAFERILRTIVTGPDDFEVEIEAGYYGDEIGTVSMKKESFNILKTFYDRLEKDHSPRACIEASLEAEYGHVLDDCVGIDWTIEEIDPSLIDVRTGYQKVNNKYVAEYTESGKKAKYESEARYVERFLHYPIGVYLAVNGRYRLIDGRHRYLANHTRPSVFIIVGRKSQDNQVKKDTSRPKGPWKLYIWRGVHGGG